MGSGHPEYFEKPSPISVISWPFFGSFSSDEECVCVCICAHACTHVLNVTYVCAGVCLWKKPGRARGGENVKVRQR